jgi:aryl-alcohol dehydrogenase-like predicted oxidoreductase
VRSAVLARLGHGPGDQVLYSLARRSPEYNLLPWCRELDLPVMSYSPIDQGDLLSHPAVHGVAERNDITPAQVALAWVFRQPLVGLRDPQVGFDRPRTRERRGRRDQVRPRT